MRQVDEIIVHCSATKPEWKAASDFEAKVAEIRRWHKGNGWSDIGYHYLIDRDGRVLPGRPVEKIGAHVKGHNTGTIGVCLIGGHGAGADDQFTDHFTPEQDKALRNLLADLSGRFGIEKITGHNQYANKGCPGFRVQAWLDAEPKPGKAPWWLTLIEALLGWRK